MPLGPSVSCITNLVLLNLYGRKSLFVQHLTPHPLCRFADLEHTIENACPPPRECRKALDARTENFLELNKKSSWMTVAKGIGPWAYSS